MIDCNCSNILTNGQDVRECFNCGRTIVTDASIYPVFNLRTQRVEQTFTPTVAADWPPFKLTFKRGTVTLMRHVPGADRRAQLETLLEAA